MSWSVVTSGAAETWTDVAGGVTQTWTATGSNTTTRNTSRFVLLNDIRTDSVASIFVHFREGAADGRGVAFYLTEGDPVVFSDTSAGA